MLGPIPMSASALGVSTTKDSRGHQHQHLKQHIRAGVPSEEEKEQHNALWVQFHESCDQQI